VKRKNLVLARCEHEMFQQEVADYLGVSQSRFSRIESGRGNPTKKQTEMLNDLFKIKVK